MFRARLLAASILGFGLTALAVGCTVPVSTDTASAQAATAKALDFAYDTNIDQIAHMSCSNMAMGSTIGYNTSAYFTYRVGAYNSGGILLKDEFFTAMKKKKADIQSEILTASPANSDTILQVALRSRTDFQSVFTRSGTAVKEQDYSNMLAPLGTEEVSDLLVAQPANSRVKHIRSGTAGGYRLEGSLLFTESTSLVQSTRDFLQGKGNSAGNTGLLAVTYTHGGTTTARSVKDVNASSTVTAARSVFGKGYIMTFAQPTVSPRYASYPENVISLISEQNLDTTSTSQVGSWTCPQSMQLRIVRNEDVIANKSGANCVKKPDDLVPSAELALVRNSLRVEDWFVDLEHRCVIPKKTGTGCYGAVTDVKYVPGDACGIVDSTGASNCVQYASICYRN